MENNVRVRFAPSPTGGMHLGGMRTVLFNYLFAKQQGGRFILRIEDTDQSRFVPGAEAYLFDCLKWCGLVPDEGVEQGGPYGPYRQSERREIYQRYAHQLVEDGFAYYAFDTAEELDTMRSKFKSESNPMPTYNQITRTQMHNSLGMELDEAREKMADGMPYVVRIKMPENQDIEFTDLIRGPIRFNSKEVDDKVLLKADGMPTYHLAVVVDDYLMKISHAFRGEEWLSSAPVHVLLWQYLGWRDAMPQWAHLPLILGPDEAKLSKRHGNKYGFPIFAMNWTDPVKQEFTEGFKERGFLPEAFINMLALLGWNNGTAQEIFSLQELIEAFSIDRIHAAGAQFDYEKAKWFNQKWIAASSNERLLPDVKMIFETRGIQIDDEETLLQIISLVKERCVLLPDFYSQARFFYKDPETVESEHIAPKWNAAKTAFFEEWSQQILRMEDRAPLALEDSFKTLAASKNLKAGELMLPLRIMLVGAKFGPSVFEIANIIGPVATKRRIEFTLKDLNRLFSC